VAGWLDDILGALDRLDGSGTYDEIYAEVARVRNTLPPTWKEIVRRRIQDHSSDSAGFKQRSDLFFAVDGIGQGRWGLRERAEPLPPASDLSGDDRPGRVPQWTYRVLRDTRLARQIKVLHRDACQLCGISLTVGENKTYSEAHHIIPLGRPHAGPDIAANIIVLCPNDHALCDMGAMKLHASQIRNVPGHRIDQANLDYHNQHIAGHIL
jgi:hypothetical protein